MVGCVARGVQDVEAELGALDRVAFADDTVGNDVASLSMRFPYANTSAPVAFTSRSVPGA